MRLNGNDNLRASTPEDVEDRVDSIWDKIDNGGGGGGGYVLPPATASTLGGIKVGSNLSVTSDGTLSATGGGSSYELPIASDSTLGGVKVGSNLSIDSETGVLSADSYSLPTASASTLGGVKVGNGLSIADGVLSVSSTPSGGGTKVRDLTFTGTGTSPYRIEFPKIPYQILSITTIGSDGATKISAMPFNWGVAGVVSMGGGGNYGIQQLFTALDYAYQTILIPSASYADWAWNQTGQKTTIRWIAVDDLDTNPYEFYAPTSDYYYVAPAKAIIDGVGYAKLTCNPTISFVARINGYTTLVHIGLSADDVGNGLVGACPATVSFKNKTWYWTSTNSARGGALNDTNNCYHTWPSELAWDSTIASISAQEVQNILLTVLGSD